MPNGICRGERFGFFPHPSLVCVYPIDIKDVPALVYEQ